MEWMMMILEGVNAKSKGEDGNAARDMEDDH